MKHHATVHRSAEKHKAHPATLGTDVHCIHCYRLLGVAETAEQRTRLVRAHRCFEGLLAKRPASPPPYN